MKLGRLCLLQIFLELKHYPPLRQVNFRPALEALEYCIRVESGAAT